MDALKNLQNGDPVSVDTRARFNDNMKWSEATFVRWYRPYIAGLDNELVVTGEGLASPLVVALPDEPGHFLVRSSNVWRKS